MCSFGRVPALASAGLKSCSRLSVPVSCAHLSRNYGRALAERGNKGGGPENSRIALPNLTEVQTMFDTLMNPVAPKASTASIDLTYKGEHKAAIETLKLMKELGYEQTSKAFNYVILACANANSPEEAQNVFSKALKVLGKDNIGLHLYTTLCYAYAKVGQLDETWDIIQTVERDTKLATDAVLYTVMLQGCINKGDSHKAWHVYWHMQEYNIDPDQVTFTQMIKLCAKTDMVERAINFYDELISKGLVPTEEVYVSLIHACAGRKDLYNYNKAFEFFLKMKEDGFHPNLKTYTALLLNSATRADFQTLEMIFDEVLANQDKLGGLDAHIYTVLIDGYSHAIGNKMDKEHAYLLIAKGEIVFKKMLEKKIPINEVTMNVILKLYTEALDEKGALNCLENRFKQYGVVAGVHSYAAMIRMYTRMGEVEHAQEMHLRLRDQGIVPPYWVYKILIKGCVQARYFKRAIKFMKEMRQHGMAPHIQDFRLFRKITEKEFPELHAEIGQLCDWGFAGTQYMVRTW